MANLQIFTAPKGSQLTSTIAGDESEDKNDFLIFITGDENFTLEEIDITLSAVDSSNNDISDDVSIVSFQGSGCSYEVVIRPMEEEGTLTVDIAENAVPEGNDAVSQNIRISTAFPDADAETFTPLGNSDITGTSGAIATTQNRILVLTVGDDPESPNYTQTVSIDFYTFDGTPMPAERLVRTFRTLGNDWKVDNRFPRLFAINDTFFLEFTRNLSSLILPSRRYPLNSLSTELPTTWGGHRVYYATPFGWVVGADTLRPFEDTDGSREQTLDLSNTGVLSIISAVCEDTLLYVNSSAALHLIQLSKSGDTVSVTPLKIANVDMGGATRDYALHTNTLYSFSSNRIQSLDIRPYRPMERNTKTTIYPVFAKNGETLDLKRFAPDAEQFIFDVGFDKPSYLSINSSTGAVSVASDATTGTQPVLVKARAINYIDSIPISLYLIIETNTAPVWRDVESLAMKADSTYDLHQIVDADSIAFESGQTQPTGSSISNDIFTIGTTGGSAYFTATKDGLTADKMIAIDVIQAPDPDNFSDIFRHYVEIAGIDVTADVEEFPEISKSLDAVQLNVNIVDGVTLILTDENGKYNPDTANNFWETNSLNPAGFNETVKVYIESLVSGAWVKSLWFSGIINDQTTRLSEVQVSIRADDVSKILRDQPVENFGTLAKWDRLRRQSDEADFEGPYVPEGSLLPIQTDTGKAWEDRQSLTLRKLALPSEGPPLTNTGHLTESDLRTSGGFLDDPPLLNFKTYPHQADVRLLASLLASNAEVYNADIDLPSAARSNPFILNRGSVPFEVERTRVTRQIVDWVSGLQTPPTVLMLLGNPEGHIADLLVQYDIGRDNFRTLYTFDKDVKAHRIERRSATLYYILTSGAITQDRSAATLPRTSDKTAFVYDSRAEGSNIRIHRYNATSNTLTEFIPEDDDRPPQLGIHIHAGFENKIYIDEFEGVTPYYRGAFRWYSGNLYYRYCNGSEFGVARVNTGGTTSEMISESDLSYWNWLNFAFSIDTSNGDLFFVYAEGDADSSKLVIKKRTSAGVESTVLESEEDLEDLNDLDSVGGAYLGCYECLFHSDKLYILCPIQRVDEDDSTTPSTYSRSREKSAGCILYSCDVNAASPELTVIEKWEFVQMAGCNLTVHNSAVHYTEQSVAASVFRAINPDL